MQNVFYEVSVSRSGVTEPAVPLECATGSSGNVLRRFEGSHCLRDEQSSSSDCSILEDGGNKVCRNVGKLPLKDTKCL